MEVRNIRNSSVALHADFQSRQGRGMEHIYSEVKAEEDFTLKRRGRWKKGKGEEFIISEEEAHSL